MRNCFKKISGWVACLFLLIFLFSVASVSTAGAADVYPKKRITFICYVKPGGGFDILARSVMPYMEKHLKAISKDSKGGGVVVKNVPAAGGRKAYSTIFNADPDGYTIGDFNSAFATEEIAAKSKIKFDYTQFTFLVRLGVSKRIILAKKGTFNNWGEMIQESKKRELKWAASNFGRGHHVSCILLKEAANMNVKLINFPGAAENINSLMRGDVDMAIATLESAVPMIQAGEFVGLAILSDKSELPGVPSIKELGYPEVADMLQLHRVFIAPPNLDKEAYGKLVTALKKVFADPEFLEQSKKINFEPEPIFGDEAEKLMKKLFSDYLGKADVLKKYLAQ